MSTGRLKETILVNMKPVSRRIHAIAAGLLIYSALTGQESKSTDLSQYLFRDFSRSTINTKSGKTITLLLNYNTVTEKMVFEQKGQYYDLINEETIDTAYIHNRLFVPQGKVFLEVILKDTVSYYIQHKSELVAPGRPAGYGTTSQLTSSNFLSGVNTPSGYYNFKLPDGYTVRAAPVYWIKFSGEMHSFLGKKQFLKIFPGKKGMLKKYIKENRIWMDRSEDILKAAGYANEIHKTSGLQY
jgi:hypothetical protein